LAGEDWELAGVPLRRHSAPVILASPDPLQGLRKEDNGSRFWVLQDGEILEVEGDNASSSPSGESISGSEFLHEALLAGFSVDEVCRAESLASDVSPLILRLLVLVQVRWRIQGCSRNGLWMQ
jgi:hypothetical protein